MDKDSLRQLRMLRGEKQICTCGKVAYDKKGALSAKNLRKKRAGIKLRVYQCDLEDVWHLSSSL